jgi:hypothetical protein
VGHQEVDHFLQVLDLAGHLVDLALGVGEDQIRFFFTLKR